MSRKNKHYDRWLYILPIICICSGSEWLQLVLSVSLFSIWLSFCLWVSWDVSGISIMRFWQPQTNQPPITTTNTILPQLCGWIVVNFPQFWASDNHSQTLNQYLMGRGRGKFVDRYNWPKFFCHLWSLYGKSNLNPHGLSTRRLKSSQ